MPMEKRKNKGRLNILSTLSLLLCLVLLLSSCTDYEAAAEINDDKTLSFQGRVYYPLMATDDNAAFFIPDKALGRTQSNEELLGVRFAGNEDFLCLRGSEGDVLYSSHKDFDTAGENISAIYMKYMGSYVHPQTDSQNIADLLFLAGLTGDELEFSYSEVFADVVLLYACYEGSPIASKWLGELGRINEHFVFVPKGERSIKEAGDFKSEEALKAVIIKDDALINSLMFLTAIE